MGHPLVSLNGSIIKFMPNIFLEIKHCTTHHQALNIKSISKQNTPQPKPFEKLTRITIPAWAHSGLCTCKIILQCSNNALLLQLLQNFG